MSRVTPPPTWASVSTTVPSLLRPYVPEPHFSWPSNSGYLWVLSASSEAQLLQKEKSIYIYIYTQESEDQKCHKVEVFPVIKKGKSASLRKQILLSLQVRVINWNSDDFGADNFNNHLSLTLLLLSECYTNIVKHTSRGQGQRYHLGVGKTPGTEVSTGPSLPLFLPQP